MKKDTIFYGISIMIERMISFFMLPILTKKMSMELYGVWSQITVSMGFLVPIVLLGFQTAIVNYFSDRTNHDVEKKNIFLFMACIVLVNLIIVIACTSIFSSQLGNFMFGGVYFAGYASLFGYLVCNEALFELLVGYLRSSQKIKILSIYYVIKSILRIGAFALGLMVFHLGLYDMLIILILLQFVFVIVIYFKDILGLSTLRFEATFWRRRSRELTLFALPLVPLSVVTWGNNFVDRYLVLHFMDIKQVGIYSVAYSLAALVGLFYSVLGFTLYPRLAQLWNNEGKSDISALLQKSMGYYLFLLIPSIALLTILNQSIIDIFTTKEYLSNWVVVFSLSSGIGLFGFYQIFFYITLLSGKSFVNLIIMAVSVIANIVFNLVFIPRIGIAGAALATALSNGILAAWTIGISRNDVVIKFPWTDMGRILFFTSIISAFLLFARSHINIQSAWSLGAVAISAGAIYLGMDVMSKNSLIRQLGIGK